MGQRRGQELGSLLLEWVSYLAVDVVDTAEPPESQPAMLDRTRIRLVGSQFVRVALLGGLANQDYTLTLLITTNLGQRLSLPVQLQVRA